MTVTAADFRWAWRLSNELFRAHSAQEVVDLLIKDSNSFFPCDSAVLFPFAPDLAMVADTGHLSRNMDDLEQVAIDYAARYHRLDPLNVLEKRHNLNRALRTQDVIGPGKYRNSEFYQDFSRPLGIETVLGVCVAQGDNPVCGLAFHRGKGVNAFSEADRERLTLLAPSIAHSLHALRLQRETEQRFDNGGTGNGPGDAVWLIEPGTKRVRCNPAAERMLRSAGGKASARPWGCFPAPVQSLVDRLLAVRATDDGVKAIVPMADTVSCRNGNHWYAFTVTRLPAGECDGLTAPLLVTAVRRSSHYEIDDRLRGMGLSARERQIAHLITRGLTNKEIANHLGIREQTVKDHLRPIFAKAGINSRTRFIARLIWGE